MNIEGLEINSPEYWELRHQRDHWPRWSKWAMSLVFESAPVAVVKAWRLSSYESTDRM